jgi:hypothetical protein
MSAVDNSGGQVELRTRQGADLRFRLDLGTYDLTGHTVVAIVYYENETALTTDVDESVITVTVPHELTEVLPAVSRYSVSIVDGDGIVTPVVFGHLYCNRDVPC